MSSPNHPSSLPTTHRTILSLPAIHLVRIIPLGYRPPTVYRLSIMSISIQVYRLSIMSTDLSIQVYRPPTEQILSTPYPSCPQIDPDIQSLPAINPLSEMNEKNSPLS